MTAWTPASPEERERLGRVAHAHHEGLGPVDYRDGYVVETAAWRNLRSTTRETWRQVAVAVARDAVAGALREVLALETTMHYPCDAREPMARCRPGEEQELGREQVLDEVRAMLREVEAPPAPPETGRAP